MNTNKFVPILKQAFDDWNKHEATRMGAALAFYTILSLSPLVIFVVALIGLVMNRSTAQSHIIAQVQSMIGAQGGQAVQSVLNSTQKPSSGIAGTIVGTLTLLFGASGVFGELRSAMNRIWDVTPKNDSGILGLLRERFFSFGMVLSIGFLLLVSLLLSTALSAFEKFFSGFLPASSFLLSILNFCVSFLGVAILFGLIFKFVPETRIDWKDVSVGALATALLFTIGKSLIGLYLGKASVGSTYGAAGSIIVLIVWVYYSAQLFLFGAEFTHLHAVSRGHGTDQRAPVAGSSQPASSRPATPAS